VAKSNKFTVPAINALQTLALMMPVYKVDSATLITVASLASITRVVSVLVSNVWQSLSPDTLSPISNYVSDTPKLDNGWNADAIGYNFRDVVPSAKFATPGKTHITYTFTANDAGSTVTVIVVECNVMNPLS